MIFLRNKQRIQQYFLPENEILSAFSLVLKQEIQQQKKHFCNLVVLCIGTNQVSGDCLGPLVGTKLREMNYPHPVYGTLRYPVHAINLAITIQNIKNIFPDAFLIAIDAAAGFSENVGYVTFSRSPLYPGEGINRPLQPVGNLSVTGIITEESLSVEQTLFHTRQDMVKQMADFIAMGIAGADDELTR